MWKKLENVIQKLKAEYTELLTVSQKKRQILIAVDLKALDAISQQEEIIIGRIHAAEDERQKVLREISEMEPRIKEDTKMAELWTYSPAEMVDSLKKAHEELTQIVGQVQETGENNKLLITGALSAVNYRLNQLGGSAVEPTYGGRGQEVVSHVKQYDFEA